MRLRLIALAAGVAGLSLLAVGNAASLTLTSGHLTPLQTCVLTATPLGTTAVTDAYVDQATAGTNHGAVATMSIQPTTGAVKAARRAYVRFDLTKCSPALATTATVRLATLRLNISSLPAALCETEDLFAVSTAWTEAAVTWTNQPAGTTLNTPVQAGRTSFAKIGGAAGCTYLAAAAYASWDGTADVASWVAGTTTNNGWVIRNDAEAAGSASDAVALIAKESNLPAREPQLIITYLP